VKMRAWVAKNRNNNSSLLVIGGEKMHPKWEYMSQLLEQNKCKSISHPIGIRDNNPKLKSIFCQSYIQQLKTPRMTFSPSSKHHRWLSKVKDNVSLYYPDICRRIHHSSIPPSIYLVKSDHLQQIIQIQVRLQTIAKKC
jgi:hypothetical protein